jgi:hypothetical protein
MMLYASAGVDEMNDSTCKISKVEATCAELGGTVNPDYCKKGGNICKSYFYYCKNDAECEESAVICCSFYKQYISMICSGVSSSKFDRFMDLQRADGCRDTNCRDGNPGSSATSLRSASSFLLVPVLGLVVHHLFLF